MKLIILLGQRVRSGTNFIGTTLNQHPDVVCIPPNNSLGEVNLFKDNHIKTHVYNQIKKSFGLGLKEKDFPKFMEEYGKLWLKLLGEKYELPSEKTIFIKSPRIAQLELWKLAFPDSQIAVLCRDGRDNVISSIKASNDRRRWHTTMKSVKKRTNYYLGRFFLSHAKDWRRTARIYFNIEENSKLKKFRYEDLNDSQEGILELLQFYKLKTDPKIIETCVNAPVVGSSFGIETGGMVKPNWKPNPNKEKFVFTGKWDRWNVLQKLLFKGISGKELIQLGYANDNKW